MDNKENNYSCYVTKQKDTEGYYDKKEKLANREI